jgi:hypothetical protein
MRLEGDGFSGDCVVAIREAPSAPPVSIVGTFRSAIRGGGLLFDATGNTRIRSILIHTYAADELLSKLTSTQSTSRWATLLLCWNVTTQS